MIWAKKIKAGALQLVLFVSTIIAVLLLCFLLLTHSQNLFVKKTDLTVQLIQAADEALRDSFEETILPNEAVDIITKNDLGISVSVTQTNWGVLPMRTVRATRGKLSFDKRALIGAAQPNRAALYLQDQQRPMVIVGRAQIVGDAFLPERGIKPGNIRGYSYNRSKLIYGQQKQSKTELLQFANAWQNQMQQLTNPSFSPKGEALTLEKGLVLKNSFKQPLQVVRGGSIRLEQIDLTGHIMVWASQKITVESTCQLQDVVLIAPHIEIKKGFRGTVQALASESIIVGKSAQLQYPSVVLVHRFKNENDNQKAHITLAADTDVRGLLFFQQLAKEERSFKAHVSIAEKAQLMGELYCSGNLELKGSVFGNVTTRGFVALENGSSYQNHLFNGQINSSLLPMAYGGLWYEDTPLNQVMKWLY
ncbi:MAG: hypothetical protein AB3N16_08135 [Flavobacteriaceae bacterium]